MGARVALCGPGRAREVVRSLGPREDCRDGMRERWAKVARLGVGEGGAACGWCPRDGDVLSVGVRACAGFILQGADCELCYACRLAALSGRLLVERACVRACERAGSEQVSEGARERGSGARAPVFLLCESSSWPVRGNLAENPRSRPVVRPRSPMVRPRSQSLGDATRTSPRSS